MVFDSKHGILNFLQNKGSQDGEYVRLNDYLLTLTTHKDQRTFRDIFTLLKNENLVKFSDTSFENNIGEGEYTLDKHNFEAKLLGLGIQRLHEYNRIISQERAVKLTGIFTILNVLVTIVFTSIIVYLQVKTFKNEAKRDKIQSHKQLQDSLSELEKSKNDRQLNTTLQQMYLFLLDTSKWKK